MGAEISQDPPDEAEGTTAASEPTRRPVTSDSSAPDGGVEILEVRPGDGERPVTITIAIAADAIQAVCTALSEQLARRAPDRADCAEDVRAVRERAELAEPLRTLADVGAHTVVSVSQAELRTCLLELVRHAKRADGEYYQPIDLRARLQTIGRISPVLWEANAVAAENDRARPRRGVRPPRDQLART